MHLFLCVVPCSWVQISLEARRGHCTPGTGVTSQSKLPDVGAGNQLGSSVRAVCVLTYAEPAISPAPRDTTTQPLHSVYRSKKILPVATLLQNVSLPFPEVFNSTDNQKSVKFISPCLTHDRYGLALFCAGLVCPWVYSFWEDVNAIPNNNTLHTSPLLLALSFLLYPDTMLLQHFLNLGKDESDDPCMTEHPTISCSQHPDQVWVSSVSTFHFRVAVSLGKAENISSHQS